MQLYTATLFRKGEPVDEILIKGNSLQIVKEEANAVIAREHIADVDLMWVEEFCPEPGA